MSDNIKVGIKVRPLIQREINDRLPIQWVVDNDSIVHIDPATNRRSETQFQFDYIFDMTKTNEDVFNTTAKPIVKAVMNGINGTIFTYGQTGSGKTYTMLGSANEKGVIGLTVDQIFDSIGNDPARQYLLRVSYIEIYNEKINDLLDKTRTELKLKEDVYGHITVDCKEEVANTAESIFHAMKRGEKLRRTGETNMNERSSRSHTILRITIESCDKSDPDSEVKEAQLNLIDLAGSERARYTGATGQRFNEGRHINLSLSTLSLVIKQLSESNPRTFVNYRDSKLTRILQESLGGNALTAIICTVTPAAIDETQCTLDFAVRAKGVKNKPEVNEVISDKALLKKVILQVRKLQTELQTKDTVIAEASDKEQMLQARIKNLLDSIASTNIQRPVVIRRRRTWAGGNVPEFSVTDKVSNFILPTIDESVEKESDSKRDRSIIDCIDLNNESFKVEFADFELQLIKDQQEKNRFSSLSDDEYLPSGLTVREYMSRTPSPVAEIESGEVTPEHHLQVPQVHCTCKKSPSTPKLVLRERLNSALSEYNSLREFKDFEKELYTRQIEIDRSIELSSMKKTLEDSQLLCLDLKRKYAELQNDHTTLRAQHEELIKNIPLVESEKNDYKNKLNITLKKLEKSEQQALSHEYEVELLKTKFRNREKELEHSLNIAWQDFVDPRDKEKLTNIIHLQSIISELTTKISSFESQSQTSPFPPIANNEDSNKKITEFEEMLKKSDEDKLRFAHQIEEMSGRLKELLEEKESFMAEKKIVENKNIELTQKFLETSEKLKSNETAVDSMKLEIDRIQCILNEKVKEIKAMKERLDIPVSNVGEKANTTVDSEEFHLALSEGGISRNNSHHETLETDQNLIATEPNTEVFKNTVEEQKYDISRLEKELENKTIELSASNTLCQEKMNDLQSLNDKLKEQLAAMQSDKTLYEGERISLQSRINDLEEQLSTFNKLETQLTFVTAEKEQHEQIINELRKQLNEKLLELEGQRSHDYESEMKNLNNYITEIQSFTKDLQEENDNLKKEVQNISSMLKNLEDDKKLLLDELQLLKETSTDAKMSKELTELQNLIKVTQDENHHLKQQVDDITAELKSMEDHNNSLICDLQTMKQLYLDTESAREEVIKNSQIENEDLKKEIEKLEISVKNLNDEKMSLISQLEAAGAQQSSGIVSAKETMDNESNNNNTKLNDSKCTSQISEVIKASKIPTFNRRSSQVKIVGNSNSTADPTELETSSIFIHNSYFENMSDVSLAPGDMADSMLLQNSTVNNSNNNTLSETKNVLEETKNLLNYTYGDLVINVNDRNLQELKIIVQELYNIKNKLEDENSKLKTTLESKNTEIDEINNGVCAIKSVSKQLEETVVSLTNENAQLAADLSEQRDCASDIQNKLRNTEKDLANRIQLFSQEAQNYQQTIKCLKEEVENKVKETEILSNDLKKKNEEFIKMEYYIEKTSILERENTELSTNLIEKIEEIDRLNDTCEVLKKRASIDTRTMTYDQLEQSKTPNKSNHNNSNHSNMCLLDDKSIKNNSSISSILEKSLHDIIDQYDENTQLLEKIRQQEGEIKELKELTVNLSNMKLNSCKECANLAEINQTRCNLKKDISRLNKRLESLRNNHKRDCADGDKLINQLKDDLNGSIHNSELNESYFEGITVADAEVKVERLETDLQTLQERVESLSVYRQDPFELQFVENNHLNSSSTLVSETSRTPSKRMTKLNEIQNKLQKYEDQQQQFNKSLMRIDRALQKMQNDKTITENELKILEKEKEKQDLNIAAAEARANELQEQIDIHVKQMKELEKQLSQVNNDNKNLYDVKSILEHQIENYKDEKIKSDKIIDDLKSANASLQDEMKLSSSNNTSDKAWKIELHKYKQTVANREAQITELQNLLTYAEDTKHILKTELNIMKSSPPPQIPDISTINETIAEYKLKVESLELTIKELRQKIDHYAKENIDLMSEITKLRAETINLNETLNHMECDDSFTQRSAAVEELYTVRSAIIRELKSLGSTLNVNDSDYRNVTDIFCAFVNELLVKEQEMVNTLQRRFDRERNTMQGEHNQLREVEKRVNVWAKELEAEIERLQNDLNKADMKNSDLKKQIVTLENSLMDAEHEKQSLNEKLTLIENDFINFQNDLEKNTHDSTSFSIQQKDKLIHDALEKCKSEHQEKMNTITADLISEIDLLKKALENVKTQNMEFINNIEGLEANERQLKSIIDVKTNELSKASGTCQRLQKDYDNMTELYNQSNEGNQAKNCKIEELTGLLKVKCDKMSEYKVKLDTITPEFESLKEQAAGRQLRLEKYKSEVENLRDENTKVISSLRDELDAEKIKYAGLTKQLNEITNIHQTNQSELAKLRGKCDELSLENDRLIRKMRNSTTKTAVEQNMELLRDENQTLSQKLEGASNRIEELLKNRNQMLEENVELKQKYSLLCQENMTLKSTVENYKSQFSIDALNLREKYDDLVLEKNRIALELEEKRLTMSQLDNKIIELTKINEELNAKNKDLDEEMDEMVKTINSMEDANYQLLADNNLLKIQYESNNVSTDQNKDLSALQQQNTVLKNSYETMMSTYDRLKQENEHLKSKLGELNEEKMDYSPKNSSPYVSSRSRQRRSDLFNQNRPLTVDKSTNESEGACQCKKLKKSVQELEQLIVFKEATITSLNMKMEAIVYPQNNKYQQLEQELNSCIKKNRVLGAEISALRALPTTWECGKCKNWKLHQCDKYIQTDNEKPDLYMNGSSASGVVGEATTDYLKDRKIEKLESDKHKYKLLSLSRLDQIRKLQDIIKAHGDINISKENEAQLLLHSGHRFGPKYSENTNSKNSALKENILVQVSQVAFVQPHMKPHRYW